jgi:hypothetical protein
VVPRPTEEEIEAANGDRYYNGDTPITLTVDCSIQGMYVSR